MSGNEKYQIQGGWGALDRGWDALEEGTQRVSNDLKHFLLNTGGGCRGVCPYTS